MNKNLFYPSNSTEGMDLEGFRRYMAGFHKRPAKVTDTRTANWEGIGQVELDAVKPEKLKQLCESAIMENFDNDLYGDLIETERIEREQYRTELKEYVQSL